MIVCHRYQFIFIKTTKTAGTSVEIALSKYCGPDDIITPISPPDELIRQARGGIGPQHFQLPFAEYGLRDFLALIRKRPRRLKFYNHMPASEIKARIPADIWNRYYKFCIERNPWDRLISFYYYATQNKEPRPTLAEFLDSPAPATLHRRGFGLYTLDGGVIADKICRYENLAEELEAVRQHLGMPEPLELPQAKGGFRPDKRRYQELYAPEQRDFVAQKFTREIELLGYRF